MLTHEQLNAPLAPEIIRPSQRFASETIFHNEAAREWYNHRDEEVVPKNETARERRQRQKAERGRVKEERYRAMLAERDAREERMRARAPIPVAVAVAEPARPAIARAGGRLAERVAERAIERVAAPIIAPAPVAPAREWPLSDEARHDTFWQIVADFGWHNTGEGPNQTRRVRDTIAGWPQAYRETFLGYFKQYCDRMIESFKTDLGDGVDMFQRNDIFSPDDEIGTVSHFVGLGRAIYENMLVDHEYAQVLITTGECEPMPVTP